MYKYDQLVDKISYELMDKMIKNGGLTNYKNLADILKCTRDMLIKNKDKTLEEIIELSISDYIFKTREIIDNKKAPGISTSIRISNGPEINIYAGMTSTNQDAVKIDDNVLFDVASLTKMFTALQVLKEHELKNIDINSRIYEIDPKFKQDATLLELLNFYHKIITSERIDKAKDEIEALELLYNSEIIESKVHVYSDIPYMIARRLLPDFIERFKKYFNDELDMKKTCYMPKSDYVITGGDKRDMNSVHDPKAKLISHAGHAGIYSTSHDLVKLFDGLSKLNFLSIDSINELTNPIIKGEYVRNDDNSIKFEKEIKNGEVSYHPMFIKRGMMYKKHGMGMKKTEVFDESSLHAFSVAGFTGCWVNFDIANGFTSNILANPFSGSDDGKKDPNYIKSIDVVKLSSLESIIKLIISTSVYEAYYNEKDYVNKRIIKKL